MASLLTEALQTILNLGRSNPRKFLLTIWGKEVEPWQLAVAEAVKMFERVSVASANGAGKTYILARIALWCLLCFPGSRVITTAGSWLQVRRQLWTEIHKASKKLPRALQAMLKINTVDAALDDDWVAIGISTKDPGLFEGHHNRFIFILVDEAKSVDQGIFDAIRRIDKGQQDIIRIIQVSSTGASYGPHYDSFHAKADMWARIMVNPFEAWAAAPGGEPIPLPPTKHINMKKLEEDAREYGKDSALYMSMALAKWTSSAPGVLWKLEYLDAALPDLDIDEAAKQGIKFTKGDVWVGGDVSRNEGDGDESVLWAWQDWIGPDAVHHQFLGMEAFHTRDVTVWGDTCMTFCKEYGAKDSTCNVEEDGIGGGAIDYMGRQGFHVNPIKSGGSAPDDAHLTSGIPFRDMRSFMWWNGSEKGRLGLVHGIKDPRTRAQLGDPTSYTDESKGVFCVEKKEHVRSRISRKDPGRKWKSPDRADGAQLGLIRPKQKKKVPSMAETSLKKLGLA